MNMNMPTCQQENLVFEPSIFLDYPLPASPASKSAFKAAKVSSRSPGSGESSRSRSKKMASGVQKGKGFLGGKVIEILGETFGGFNPFEKYARQNGFIFPNFRGENSKKYLKPPSSFRETLEKRMVSKLERRIFCERGKTGKPELVLF